MKKKVSADLKAWQDRIAVMFLVQEEVRRQDRRGILQYFYPELAATEEQLAAAEAYLGEPLEKGYRDFLLCSNGWRCFHINDNLFGTEDLMGSDLMNYALEMLDILDDAFPLSESIGFSKEELLPIAATFEDRNLFVMTRLSSHQPGIILWLSGEEIERFPDFEEYFLAMADYNRQIIDLLKSYQ